MVRWNEEREEKLVDRVLFALKVWDGGLLCGQRDYSARPRKKNLEIKLSTA